MALSQFRIPQKPTAQPLRDRADLSALVDETRSHAVETLLRADALDEQLQALSAPPGAFPGAVSALPASKIGDDRSDVGWLYGQLTGVSAVADAALPLTGGTLTGTLNVDMASGNKVVLKKSGSAVITVDANGSLDVNLPSDLGVIAQFRHAGITDAFFSSTGNQHLRGNMGIGPFADTPPYRLWVREPEVETSFSNTIDPGGSGGIGWVLNKPSNDTTSPITFIFQINGVSKFGYGMDHLNHDYVPVYDHQAGWNDAGAQATVGADVLRFTPAPDSSTTKSTSWHWSGQQANTNNTTTWGIMEAGINQSGIRLSIHGGSSPSARDHLLLENRNTGVKRNIINFGSRWSVGMDVSAVNTSDFFWYDGASAAANKIRMRLVADAAESPKIGIGTPNTPLACLHTHLQSGTLGNTVIETPYAAGYSQDLANRMMGMYQSSDGTTVRNFFLMSGQLVGTAAAPTLTSTGAISAGLERTDTELSLALAPAGATQTIVRPLRVGATNTLGLYGVSPVARQSIAAAATDAASTQTLANSIRTILLNIGIAQ